MEAKLAERLATEDLTDLTKTRQNQLLAEARRITDSAYKDATGELQVDVQGLASYEGEYQLDLFEKAVPVKLEMVKPAVDQLLAAVNDRPFQGKLLKDVYSDLEQSASRKVREAIRLGFTEGRTTAQIIQDLKGRKRNNYKDGVFGYNRRGTDAVVRTALSHTANTARDYTYERNSDLIKGVRWVSTLDGRTSPICRARDGKVYDAGKGPRPPAHFNCRSSTSPVLKSWRELGFDVDDLPPATRASMDGQVPSDLSYGQWLRKQSEEFQDETLGPARANLFRSGLKIDRFVDTSGREMNLSELSRVERGHFQHAGL